MKKYRIFLTLLAALFLLPFGARSQQELTVADGTQSNSYIPLYGFYADYNQHSQIVYPASMLEELVGATISSISFYATDDSWYFDNTTLTVKAGTTSNFAGFGTLLPAEDFTQVFSGTYSLDANNVMTLQFDNAFTYTEGDLVIDITYASHLDGDNYGYMYFYGIQTENNMSANAYSSYSTATQSFIPKTTFGYTPGSTSICYSPAAVAASNITTNSMTITVTEREDAGTVSYELQYKASSAAWDNEEAVTTVNMSGLTAEVSNLAVATSYDFRVRTICSTESTSGWKSTSARTLCDVITEFPWTETFSEAWTSEGTANAAPACWTVLDVNGDKWSYTSDGINGGSAKLYTDYNSANNDWLISPQLQLSGNQQVRFMARNNTALTSERDEVSVWITNEDFEEISMPTSPTDSLAGFTCIFRSGAIPTGDAQEYEVSLAGYEGVHYIAFVRCYPPADGWNLYLDDVVVENMAACPRPFTFRVDSVKYNAAYVSWDAVEGVSGYRVSYNTENDFSTATAMDDIVGSDVTSAAITDLSADTRYYAWIQSVCGTDEVSNTREANFQTTISCFPVQDLTLTTKTSNAAAFQWSFSEQGITPTQVNITLKDLTAEDAEPQEFTTENNYYFFENLENTHAYRAIFKTQCEEDIAHGDSIDFSFAQCGEISGDGTSTSSYLPFTSNYNYGYSQSVYPFSSFSDMEAIEGVAFNVSSAVSTPRTVDVYVGRTTADAITSFTIVPAEGLTLVASNLQFGNHVGWDTLMFTAPYTVEGNSNLVIAVVNKTGSYTSGMYCKVHEGSSVHCYSDDYQYSPTILPSSYSWNTSSYAPDIRFVGECSSEITCEAPMVVISTVSAHEATVVFQGGLGTPIVEYKKAGDSTWTDNEGSGVLSELQAGSYYNVRVSSLCDGDTTLGSVLTFVTDCAPVNVPFDFGQGDLQAVMQNGWGPCWDYTNFYRTYNQSINLYYLYSSYENGYFVLPEIAEPLSTTQFRARVVTEGANSGFRVGVLEGNTPNWIDTVALPQSDSLTQAVDYTIYLDSYTGEGTRPVLGIVGSSNVYFLDFHVEALGECRHAENIAVSEITATTATVTWEGEGSEWMVYVNGEEVGSTGNQSYELTDLPAASGITVTVRTMCGDELAEPISTTFRTDCEGGSCMVSIVMGDQYGDGWNGGAVQLWQNSGLLKAFTIESGSSAVDSASVCAGAPVELRFVPGQYPYEISFTLSGLVGELYSAEEGDLSSTASGTVLATLDNVCTSCHTPVATVDEVTFNSVTVSWTDEDNEGATYTLYQNDEVMVESTGDMTYTFGDLTDGTNYVFKVVANCSADEASNAAVVRAATLMTPADLPYSTGFEEEEDVKWLFANGVNGWYIDTAVHAGEEGITSMYISNNEGVANAYNTSNTTSSYAYKTFNIEAGQYGLSFDWRSNGESGWDYACAFLVPDSVTINADVEIPTSSRTEITNRLQLKSTWQTYDSIFNVAEGGVYKFVFFWRNDGSSGNQPPAAIDNISIAAVACPMPMAITVSDVTESSITVNVTAAEGANVKIRWTAAGTTDTAEATNVALPYTIENLTSATTYTIIASVVCEDGSETRSLSATATTTMVPVALPYSTGFEEGDDAAWLFANGSNAWVIGSAVHAGETGTNAMYISNDNGTSNSYTRTTTIVSYASKLFSFDEGNYAVSYDWHAVGEVGYSTYDYMRVLLAPATAELTAGTLYTGLSYQAIPTGWISLDGEHSLAGQAEWQHYADTIAVPTAGNYKVVIVWRNDSSSGDDPAGAIDNISIAAAGDPQPPIGIEDVETVMDVTLFPNPASNMVTIAGIADNAQVSIIDLNGREVYNQKANGSRLQVNVDGFAKGAYFVRVVSEKNNVIRKLIVK